MNRKMLAAPAALLLLTGCGATRMTGIGDAEADRGTVATQMLPTLGGVYQMRTRVKNDTDADCTYAAEVDGQLLTTSTVAAGQTADRTIPTLPLMPGVYAVRMSSGCPWELTLEPAA